jgi:hypothetical protein
MFDHCACVRVCLACSHRDDAVSAAVSHLPQVAHPWGFLARSSETWVVGIGPVLACRISRSREVQPSQCGSPKTPWTLEIVNRVVVTARFGEHAAADGNGVWIVMTCPARLFDRCQAITALTVAELLAVGYAHMRGCLRMKSLMDCQSSKSSNICLMSVTLPGSFV